MPVGSGTQKGGLDPSYQPGNVKSGSAMETAAKTESAVNPKAVGIQGMHDLQLSPDGVLSSSKGKQVKLGQDVRMNVHVDILE
jgi:hypothetical protein